MKKNFITMGLVFIAALALSVSCIKQEENVSPKIFPNEETLSQGTPFELYVGPVETKTTTDGSSFSWVAGDQINVFHKEVGGGSYGTNDPFSIASEDIASNKFTGTLTEALDGEKTYNWYVFYPYSSYITTPENDGAGYLSIGSSGKTIPQVQAGNSSKAHLAGQYFPLYGKAEDVPAATKPNITLSQALSIVKVHVTNANAAPLTVSSVSFTANEPIIGSFYINFSGATPTFTKSGDSYVSNVANLSVTSGEELAQTESADFYIAIKPFTAAASSTLKVAVNGYEKTLTIGGSAVDFLPGKIKTVNFSYDYAGIAEPTAVDGWYRVESADWLNAGDRVIIANHDGSKAMSKTYKANNRDGVDVTTAPSGDYTVLTNNDNVQMFILEEGTTSGSFAFWADNGDDASKYMYAASSSNNYLKFQESIDANASFVATLVDGLGNLTAQGSYTRKVVQWNNLFACYASATYNSISIYKYYGVWSGSTTCADPVISQEGTTVTITCATPGVKIYYTTDDSTPTTGSTLYSAPFTIASPVTVKAIAVRSHYSDSGVTSQACTLKVATPVIDCSGAAFTITCATDGATIYYETSTTDLASVTTPTTSSSVYSSAVDIAATTYVKAFAVKDGYTDSEVASKECTYSGSQTVYLETFGSTSSNTAFTSYTGYSATTSMFSTSGEVKSHYSGEGKVGKNNLSSPSLSDGYTGASGLSGCYHTGVKDTEKTIIQISDIDINGYTDLSLSFGALGGTNTHKVNVSYIIDGGSEKSLISDGTLKSGSWTLLSEDIPETGSSLTLIFKHTPGNTWTIRLDDIKVVGTK